MTFLPFEPDALIVLVGPSGSGKSTWAARHFAETQVVSSDRCRALVSDSEENQTVNPEAFAVFYTIIQQRLRLGRLTVADSTALELRARLRLGAIARFAGRPAHAVTFPSELSGLIERASRRDRKVPEDVIRQHHERFREIIQGEELLREGFRTVWHLSAESFDSAKPVIMDSPQGTEEINEGRLTS